MKNEKQNFKIVRRNKLATYKGMVDSWFLTAVIEARSQYSDIFSMLSKNNCQLGILNPVKLFCKIKGKMTFSGKSELSLLPKYYH